MIERKVEHPTKLITLILIIRFRSLRHSDETVYRFYHFEDLLLVTDWKIGCKCIRLAMQSES